MIKGIHHVGLTVNDLSAAASFYANAANMVVVDDFDTLLEPIDAALGFRRHRMLQCDNAYLRLLEPSHKKPLPTDPRPVADEGIVHICLQSPDIDHLYKQFAKAGSGFHAPPVDLGTGYLYSYARDLEKNVVELEGVPPVWPDPKPWVAHVSFSSSHVDRLANFYATILGQEAIRSPRLGPHPRMDLVSGMKNTTFKAAWIPSTNMQVEVIQYLEPPTVPRSAPHAVGSPGYCYVCIEVDDLVAAKSHLLASGAKHEPALEAMCALGAKVKSEDSIAHDFCTDPDGNLLMLLKIGEANSALSISSLPDAKIISRMNILREKFINASKNSKQKAAIS
jgi:catechol 2,3-dioxygenase-like lactoylglutathione lyase family enzyme